MSDPCPGYTSTTRMVVVSLELLLGMLEYLHVSGAGTVSVD
jgi:hypothetical protein